MIDKELVEKNRKRLLAEKKRLKGLLSRVARKSGKDAAYQAKYPDFGNKEDENASEVAQYEANIAEERDLEQQLNRVKTALERIESGTYGICQKGGEEMPAKRLEAVPEAETCIGHAEK